MWDAIDAENMITLHQYAPIFQLMKEPDYDNADPASLQMLTQNYYPVDSEGEVEYLNL